MRLTSDEQVWLDAYRQVLQEQHPGVVARMVIYGSKARGDDHPDSDLDVLLIVQNEAAHLNGRCGVLGTSLQPYPTRYLLFSPIPRTSGRAGKPVGRLFSKL